MTHRFAPRPEPPYYAVIFTSQRTAVDGGYGAMADRMGELQLAILIEMMRRDGRRWRMP